jgi:dTDP-4-amino-4,6-dideoxygalactose transaminase
LDKQTAAPVDKFPPRRDSMLVFGAPDIREEDIAAVVATLRSGWVGTGPQAARFEEAFARAVGASYAVALNSCTAALHLALAVSGVGPGDEVITTPLTFCATVNAIIHAGATPVLVDVDRRTQNIDVNWIERAITPRTKALLPVHFAGRPCAMEPLLALARRHGLVVIEDAAHAFGAAWRGTPVGALGDLTCFSFYVTKNITTVEGGMVTTNHRALADQIKTLGLHGLSHDAWRRFSDTGYRHYEVTAPGFKYNLTDVQAALGLSQLARQEEIAAHRRLLWAEYDRLLADLPLEVPAPETPGTRHARHLYTVPLDLERIPLTRDAVMTGLLQANIGTGLHYVPVHLHEYYQRTFGYRTGDFPRAEAIGERTISLPLGTNVTREDAHYVAEVLRALLRS